MNANVPQRSQAVVPTDEQLLEAVRLGDAMWSESPVYSHETRDIAKMIEFAYTMRADPNSFFRVVAADTRVTGFFIGSLAPYGFNTDMFAFDRLMYVTPTARGSVAARTLITAFEQWAIDNGAARVLLGVTTGVHTERTERFYNKLGYSTVGVLTMKEIR